MAIFFTSDLHFGHKNILQYSNRPFKDIEHMAECLIENWNKIVTPDDIVHVIGDYSFPIDLIGKYTPRLNGTKYLTPGNHDRPHPSYKGKTPAKFEEWRQKYIEWGFAVVSMDMMFQFKTGLVAILNHLPYEDPEDTYRDDPTRLRHAKDRPVDLGTLQLCGHVHDRWLTSRTSKGSLMINVGVDAPHAPWSGQFRPATAEEVIEVYVKNQNI